MTELEQIGKLYLDWLVSHRKAWEYHKMGLYLLSNDIENPVTGEYEQVIDERPPNYKDEFMVKIKQWSDENSNAEKLYSTLLEKADIYLANNS
ncbi:hypothetical protein LP111_12945 [Moraxella bovis]|uniref:Uncharacterized protein n=1 Tax=Moraxella bovis TaxID=476 RepID=A0ABY6M6H1_MORBO|nr:hypothetical protein [Moraxella bovis]UZA02978.1 hypothetical protein LP092_13740 [Moraxella bovis]UZA54069.1 hypothetical protein LP111_12945 [Moraxella bovis]